MGTGTCAQPDQEVSEAGQACGHIGKYSMICRHGLECAGNLCVPPGNACENSGVIIFSGTDIGSPLNGACPGSCGATATKQAAGYLGYPDANPGTIEKIYVDACAPGAPKKGLFFQIDGTTPGQHQGHAEYSDGTTLFEDDYDGVTIAQVDPVGGSIKGGFDLMMYTNGTMVVFNGAFSVCRVPDLLPP
jgi:hypothetical protein